MITRRFKALLGIVAMLGLVNPIQAATGAQVKAQVVLANCAPISNITELRYQTKTGVEVVTTLPDDTEFICHMDAVVDGQEKILLTVPVPFYPNPGDVLVFDPIIYQNHSF